MRIAEPYVAATPGHLLVVFREGTDPLLQAAILSAYTVLEHRPEAAAGVIKVEPGVETRCCIQNLSGYPTVQFVQPHHHIGMRYSSDTGN